jgi:serine/threonine protein phosphatase PrpC
MRATILLGRHWPELGPLALAELPGGGALALSRGAQPKAYAHQDPNEDAALIARLPGGVLLAVADGFNGVEAAELAIERTRARAAQLVEAADEAFRAQVLELLADVAGRLPRGSRSRACLVLAAVVGTRIELASFGDACAFRARSPLPLVQQNALLVGAGTRDPRALDPGLWHWSALRARGERVALVSDGITNFVPDPSEIPSMLAAAPNDLEAARALARAALEGGAGDNVAVATASD